MWSKWHLDVLKINVICKKVTFCITFCITFCLWKMWSCPLCVVKKQGTIENNYIPPLFICHDAGPNFTLPPSHDIWYVERNSDLGSYWLNHQSFIHLIGSNCCLLVVQDLQGVLNVYLEPLNSLGNAMKAKPKKIFHSDRLGSDLLFAFDKVTQILVIYATVKVRIRNCNWFKMY